MAVGRPWPAQPGAGRRHDHAAAPAHLRRRAAGLCHDAEHSRPRPKHFDPRHPRPGHGADRHQPRHRSERDRADGVPMGDRSHRQPARAAAILGRGPGARHRRRHRSRNGVMVAFVEAPALFVTLATTLDGLWRGLLDRAGLRRLCAAGRGGAAFRRARRPVRHSDADLRLCRGRTGHARLPVTDLDRPFDLCARRQRRGGAARRRSAAAADRARAHAGRRYSPGSPGSSGSARPAACRPTS